MRRLWRVVLLTSLLVLAAPVLLIAALLTETGSSWLIGRLPELAKPLGIEISVARSGGTFLRQLQLQGLRVSDGSSSFEAAHLRLHWQPLALLEGRVELRELVLQDARLVLPPPTEAPPTALEIPDLVLPIELRLDRFQLLGLRVEQTETLVVVDRAELSLRFDESGLTVGNILLEAEGVGAAGTVNLQPTAPHRLSGELSVDVSAARIGEEIGPLAASLTLSGRALAPELELQLREPTQAQMRAALELEPPEPLFDVVLEWPGLQWPLRGEPELDVHAGRMTLRGSADDYALALRTRLRGPQLPAAAIELQARGGLAGLTLAPLRIDVLAGEVQVDGRLEWADGVRWDLALLARDLDPGGYLPEWPGRIGADIGIVGALGGEDGGQPSLEAAIRRIDGELRGQPVRAAGSLRYAGGALQTEKLTLTSGPNRVYLDGRIDERLDLGFEIEAPELAAVLPGLAGKLAGEGRLAGARLTPEIRARLDGEALAYQDLRLQSLGVDLDWKASGGSGKLRLQGLEVAGNRFDRADAEIAGTPEQHRLTLSAEGPSQQVALRAQGGVREAAWQGVLERLSLADEALLGEWRSEASVKLRLGATEMEVGRLCMLQSAARACVGGSWGAAQGMDVTGSLAGFDLAPLAEQLPGEARVEGRLSGEFALQGTAENPQLSFKLLPGDGKIRLEQGEQPLTLDYRNARIAGTFADDRGNADLEIELGGNGRAEGRVSLGKETAGQRQLGGRLAADFPDLALVAGFVPELQQVAGRLHLDATLGGTLAEPAIKGALELLDGRAEVPAAGIALTDIGLRVEGSGSGQLRVRGEVTSGTGRLALQGEANMGQSGGPGVDLRLQGEEFLAVQLPEAKVLVSPDLRLQGRGPFHLSGKVLVPEAAIKLKELPSGTLSVSEDEIVVGAAENTAKPSSSSVLTARVRVELGDDVTFSGFGLETALTGVLDTGVDARGPSVNGNIELRDGRYEAYGQDLKVQRGRLLFAGPPANPDVDLLAMRESRDGTVKAFLSMNGPLSKPRPRVYSEPPLPDAEALAYLLTGNGLRQADREQGVDIAGAALSLGVNRVDPLLQEMSSRLGIDDLRIETGDSGIEDTSLVLGKYLNPDLYLGYTQGLFNAVGAVLVRLKLSERLEVETRSGEEQSVDLFYRLEHD